MSVGHAFLQTCLGDSELLVEVEAVEVARAQFAHSVAAFLLCAREPAWEGTRGRSTTGAVSSERGDFGRMERVTGTNTGASHC